MGKKLLTECGELWQAEMIVVSLLRERGIHAELQRSPREYASIVSGVSGSPARIYVAHGDYVRAKEFLRQSEKSTRSNDDEKTSDRNYFKRVILMSLLGIFLIPIIFNWVAFENYKHLDDKNGSPRKIIATIVLVLGWMIAIGEIMFIYKSRS